MSLTKVATLALSVAFAATIAAAPQTTKPAAPKPAAKTTEQKAAPAKPAPPKAEMVKKEDLPKAVTDAVMKMHPKAEITGATKSMKDGKAWFKVSYKDAGKPGSVTLDDMGMKAAPKKGK